MSDKSAIEWTDATWNPATGCTKVSPGCDHCYAETFAERWRGIPGHHFENGFDLTLRPERVQEPLRWKARRRVFVNSMSDLFHRDVPDDFIAQCFATMMCANQHTFQVLTKRPDRMRRFIAMIPNAELPSLDVSLHRPDWGVAHAQWPVGEERYKLYATTRGQRWPFPNVWLGVSVESEGYAWRANMLRETTAAKRFLSLEPLLGPISASVLQGMDWVIVGGESGAGARSMDPAWVRSIRDDCKALGIPFFFKQWGGVHKKAAGRELDGRTYDEYPA